MLAKLKQQADVDLKSIESSSHVLIVLPNRKNFPLDEVPFGALLAKSLTRKRLKREQLVTDPVTASTDDGTLVGWAALDSSASLFEQQVQIRKVAEGLLAENPAKLT